MPTCKKCSEQFPNRVDVNGEIKVINHRSYCLKCQPFGSKTRLPYVLISERHFNKCKKTKICRGCKQEKNKNEFYSYKDEMRVHPYCKICHTNVKKNQLREIKIKSVKYKGGKCQRCGYNKCVASLDFHHKDPSQKEFTISSVKCRVWNIIQKELDKCDILCKNCHAEEHFQV